MSTDFIWFRRIISDRIPILDLGEWGDQMRGHTLIIAVPGTVAGTQNADYQIAIDRNNRSSDVDRG